MKDHGGSTCCGPNLQGPRYSICLSFQIEGVQLVTVTDSPDHS
jgi:hypothetical protein